MALAFAFYGFITTGDSDGWSSLARLVIVLLAGVYLVGVCLSWAMARYALVGVATTTATLIVGPPILTVLPIMFVRAT
jgi:hypothetical protein